MKTELVASYTFHTGWTEESLMVISHFAMTRNLQFRLFGLNSELIWDSGKMVGDQNRGSRTGSKVPLLKNGVKVGELETIAGTSQYYEHEQQFLALFNNLLWGSLFFVLVGVYFFSRYISNGISAPLLSIKDAAIRIQKGNLKHRVSIEGNDEEIVEVGTALNHLAESLQEQENLRKHLTADIAHELRTPLAIVQSHIEAIQDGVWEPTPDKLKLCHEQIMRLVHLVSDLEKLADAENPMLKLKPEAVEISHVIHEAAMSVEKLWAHKNIRLDLTGVKPVILVGDPKRLLQVFVNLLNNAFKFTPEPGTIRVAVSEETDWVLTEISDTGIGISSDELPFIFERFYRGEKSRNRKTGGAGLGLAIVKAIVEAHGGQVSVKSEMQKGSTFTVRLPKSLKQSASYVLQKS
ncbi:sensor histidine kinase [Effusibacillus lacus]|uniref:sensor histidine kinase n=1 Tax=Effusibacillus lacus TaxID=1348429 RepID=UPI001E2CBC0B|nr:HAMP domain-containing sensor histidine kinase [Effusibacillus lacus]